MGKPTGFLEYERETAKVLPPKVRIANFKEFRTPLNKEKQKLQGARCMACGVPFCQSGMMIGGMASGCPLHNLVPETNDLVYTGNWKQAFLRLSKTHSFPEFTSRVCPALCEAACTCNINGEPVSTKENERAIIETAYENGWVTPQIPEVRTGKSIAVIGSGPSGLAAAQQLNRRGHSVTVFERKDRVGGLLRYGIPNMKLDKAVVDRRIHLMEEEGVKFVTNVNVGKDIKAEELLKWFAQLEKAQEDLRRYEAQEPEMIRAKELAAQIRAVYEIAEKYNQYHEAETTWTDSVRALKEWEEKIPEILETLKVAEMTEKMERQKYNQEIERYSTISEKVRKSREILNAIGQKEKEIQCDADHSQTGEGSQTDSSGCEVTDISGGAPYRSATCFHDYLIL